MLKNKLTDRLPEDERKSLLLCFVSTFIFGIVAHAYGFLNDIFSHDSLNALYSGADENMAKIAVGRFLVPVIRAVRGPVALPWLIGIAALVWIALSTCLILKIFDVRSKTAAVIISGFMVTNNTVAALTATYVHELDIDMFALLLSCLAAYLWKNSKKITGLIPVVLLSAASMAIYQSYAEVTVTLIILVLILETLENGKLKDMFLKGVRGAVSVGVAAGIYFVLNKLICRLFNTAALERVDVTAEYENSLLQRFLMIFKTIAIPFFSPPTVILTIVIAAVNGLIFLGIAVAVIVLWKKNKIAVGGKLFTLLLIAMLPLGMDFVCLLTHMGVHDIMIFSFWFIYVFAVVMFFRYPWLENRERKKKVFTVVSLLLVGTVIWNNVLVSNTVYLKKDMEKDVTLSMINRIIDDLEERDDYVIGETEVSFAGYPDIHTIYPGFKKVSHMVGLHATTTTGTFAYTDFYNAYDNLFKYYFNYPINVSDAIYTDDERLKDVPSYPEDGYIQNIDGILVVKLGDGEYPSIGKNNLEEEYRDLKNLIS